MIKVYTFLKGVNFNHFSNNFATPNAAAAAIAPISVTRMAPHHGFTPVILLLKNPKTNRQISVATTENFKASEELSIKKYGLKGIIPPAT